MYSVRVRDHLMIAHSFRGEVFGPAQALHGATYVVDVIFRRPELDQNGIVLDIGRAIDGLKAILAGLNYKNLDADPAFAGRNTTTEVLAKTIFDRMVARLREGELGPGADGVTVIEVELNESHVASASYQGPVPRRDHA
jgi:6-pyruvoyl-tetrahydropterin synthase